MKEDERMLLACVNVCVKCKASVAAALRDRCSPIVGEVGKIRQSQMLQGFVCEFVLILKLKLSQVTNKRTFCFIVIRTSF